MKKKECKIVETNISPTLMTSRPTLIVNVSSKKAYKIVKKNKK